MPVIRLPRGEWHYDEARLLGKPGGFGEVFLGKSGDLEIAVKRLKIDAETAAFREIKIVEELAPRNLQNVVPILDSGQDAESDRYFIVMPRCDYSLDELIAKDGPFGLDAGRLILLQILHGLEEVADLTHRDLKPGNILFYNGSWRLADFGIAKFVEDATSLETLKGCLTPEYAAPEQWKGEKISRATDLYALGCIAYTVFSGRPPFNGSIAQIRAGHLSEMPPTLNIPNQRLSSFIAQMLRKTQAARPTLSRCLQSFSRTAVEQKSAFAASNLQSVAKRIDAQVATAEINEIKKRNWTEDRNELAKEARKSLMEIRDRFFESLCEVSENVIRREWEVNFGSGTLRFDEWVRNLSVWKFQEGSPQKTRFQQSAWDPVCFTAVGVSQSGPPKIANTWSASLVYADTGTGDGYRWYEISFFSISNSLLVMHDPHALDATERDFEFAISPTMHTESVAYGPCAIDGEDEEKFFARWEKLLAKAAEQKLWRPGSFPIRDFC